MKNTSLLFPKTIIGLFSTFLLLFSSSCLDLDGFAFSPDKLESYQFESNPDPRIETPASFSIADSMTHLFTISSLAEDGKTAEDIYAVYIGDTNRIGLDTVFLYFHGNAGNMDVYWPRMKMLANLGHKHRFGVLAIDYQGYGMSSGVPNEQILYNDAQAALDWLEKMGLTDDRLAIFGFSLGTAPSSKITNISTSLKPSWLFLEAPFASFSTMTNDATGLSMPGSFVANLQLDNGEQIKTVDIPFFWIHGVEDDFIRISTHGEVVFKNYKGPRGEAWRIEGANHSGIPEAMGISSYMDAILDFID